jgi:hypothetical protein
MKPLSDDRHEDWSDDALLAELNDALVRLPAEEEERLLEGARAAFSFRTMDEEIAALEYDSLLDLSLADVGRAARTARTVTFRSGDVSVQLEITEDGLVGQVVPMSAGRIAVHTMGGERFEADCDELGCFLLPVPGDTPVQLELQVAGRTIRTDWVRLGGV